MKTQIPFYPVGQFYTRKEIEPIVEQIREIKPGFTPEIAIILGTGFSDFANKIEDPTTIHYNQIPFLASELQTPGHIPEFVLGRLQGKNLICARGKIFLNDGVPAQVVALPIRLSYLLGCRQLIYTSTSGAINPEYAPGEFVFINNHINLMGHNPIIGEHNGEWGPSFFDMSYPYESGLRQKAQEIARSLGFPTREGVYAGVLGPSFETAAEIQFLARCGADLVGESTIMEVIAARQLGMQVLGIGFVSNMAAGLSNRLVENNDVLLTTTNAMASFSRLVQAILATL
ncbi:MAG: purine-nucleoside phosphorylase [Chloroflexi bacterium]|nr:purine-nucleoside phosphorylase [Chloroflexota bacterium]